MKKHLLTLKSGNCPYINLKIQDHNESFLVDTGFSLYLSLNNKLKKIFPKLYDYISFEVECILGDSSTKTIRQYVIPELNIFNKTLKFIPVSFNKDESIIGTKLLKELKGSLFIKFENRKGYIKL